MSTSIISQQNSTQHLLDELEKVFPLGSGLQILPPRPGQQKKRVVSVEVTRQMVQGAYTHSSFAVGLYLPKGGKTRFCIVDIDKGGKYHQLGVVQKLITLAQDKGIELHLMRSSSSEGWHLVGFFSEPVSNRQVAAVLHALTLRAGLTVQSGQCEIFPSPNVSRRAVRLPFQPGSAWLNPSDGSVLVEAETLSLDERLQGILNKVSAATATASKLKTAYDAARKLLSTKKVKRSKATGVKKVPATMPKKPRPSKTRIARLSNDERLALGKQYYDQGLAAPGQLNEGLFLVGYHLFSTHPDRFGYEHAAAREEALLEWVTEKHNGQSRTINAGNWNQVVAEIHRMTHTPRKRARGRGQGDYTYLNEKRRLEAQSNIQLAVWRLQSEGRSVSSVSKSELATLAGVTRKTVNIHWELIEALDAMAPT